MNERTDRDLDLTETGFSVAVEEASPERTHAIHHEHPMFWQVISEARVAMQDDIALEYRASWLCPLAPLAAFDRVRDLSLMCEWFPEAVDLRPHPGGLVNAGDYGLLCVRREHVLLRVIAFVPGRRWIVALAMAAGPLLIELRVRASPHHSQGARIDLGLNHSRWSQPVHPSRAQDALDTLGHHIQTRLKRLCGEVIGVPNVMVTAPH